MSRSISFSDHIIQTKKNAVVRVRIKNKHVWIGAHLKTYFSSGLDSAGVVGSVDTVGNISDPALFLLTSLMSTTGKGNLTVMIVARMRLC